MIPSTPRETEETLMLSAVNLNKLVDIFEKLYEIRPQDYAVDLTVHRIEKYQLEALKKERYIIIEMRGRTINADVFVRMRLVHARDLADHMAKQGESL